MSTNAKQNAAIAAYGLLCAVLGWIYGQRYDRVVSVKLNGGETIAAYRVKRGHYVEFQRYRP